MARNLESSMNSEVTDDIVVGEQEIKMVGKERDYEDNVETSQILSRVTAHGSNGRERVERAMNKETLLITVTRDDEGDDMVVIPSTGG